MNLNYEEFKDFCRCMRFKWYFRDEPTPFFSEQPSFSPNSSWSSPVGHPNLEVFLSQIEQELFRIPDKSLASLPPIPTLPRRSGKPLDLPLMIDLSL